MLSYHFISRSTGKTFSAQEPRWSSPQGELLDLIFVPRLEPSLLRNRPCTLWRYRECLPIEHDEHIVTLGEGFTPIASVTINGMPVMVKQEQLYPTGSYKDRGATVLLSKVKELGVKHVVQDSSGNAGCAIAAYAAAASVSCDIFVPESTAPAKLLQIEAYGAQLHKIAGERQAAADAALEASRHSYYASHVWNPFFLQGTKTFAYEIWEQLPGQWPDAIVLPVGNGTLLLGAYIGFLELLEMGLIERLPRLIGVQAGACAPLCEAWRQGMSAPLSIKPTATLAEGIAIAKPLRGSQILAAIRATGGAILAVDDEQIRASWQEMAWKGFYIEPTAAATMAGVSEFLKEWDDSKILLTVVTGHGLKSIKSVH
jgi:threonine synthase